MDGQTLVDRCSELSWISARLRSHYRTARLQTDVRSFDRLPYSGHPHEVRDLLMRKLRILD